MNIPAAPCSAPRPPPPHAAARAPARAGAPTIKIGVLNDMSGPYTNTGGPTSVICCKQALEDFGVSGKGLNVEVISADHQNKPDLGGLDRAAVVRPRRRRHARSTCRHRRSRWPCSRSCREKNKVYLNVRRRDVGPDRQRSARRTSIHWTYDTYMLAKSTGGAMVKAGGDSWYFLTADYAFGKQLQARHHRAS